METIIGTCGRDERCEVCWDEGNCIVIRAANILIVTDTRDKNEAVLICQRNLYNFTEV